VSSWQRSPLREVLYFPIHTLVFEKMPTDDGLNELCSLEA
jgi:hypothetical protein